MKKREIYAWLFMMVAALAIREAQELLGIHEEPIPAEIRYKGNLINDQEMRDNTNTIHLEFLLKIDSIYDRSPGRSSRLIEFYARRARRKME